MSDNPPAPDADIARVRCGLTPEDPATVRDDDAQRGLEVFE